MPVSLLIQGIIIGFIVAVPVGPLGLLCVNRALAFGAVCGLFSGLGVATADALAAGIAALGITLISSFLFEHQMVLRLIGGIFLCVLGYKIYRTPATASPPTNNVSNLFSDYVTTFFLTFSNPVTIFSFMAIYAGWGLHSMHQQYLGAAVLMLGVFMGSAFWWFLLFVGLTLFRDAFSMRVLRAIYRVSGGVIAVFGFIVLLTVSPLKTVLGIHF